jgi:hypothetical protein
MKKIFEKLFCPLTAAIIQMTILFFLFFNFNYIELSNINPFQQNIFFTRKVIKNIKEEIVKCDDSNFVSWIILDNNYNFFYFKDVIGLDLDHEPFSVKSLKLNDFYFKRHPIENYQTSIIFSKLKSGNSSYYEDNAINILSKNNPTIKNILENSNHEITKLAFTILQQPKDNLTHIFIITSILNPDDKIKRCHGREMLKIVENIARKVKI